MAVDDVLWKNVEAVKNDRSPASIDSPAPSKPARKSPRTQDTVSPSRATNSMGSTVKLDAISSTQGDGTPANPTVPDQSAESNNANQTNGRTHDRTRQLDARLFDQVPARPAQRRPERYAFQFWADQITRLKKLRQVLNMAMDPDDRTEITLSDLVRTAVDDYLDRETGRIKKTDGAV